ncbi:hypothetical protein SAMN05892883_3310 [Jatrophihabitans sp. GAS493]|uniref:DUF3046 domain-containing protein n=1 Tax=Jatrophihabitans sp. GAS493 TaxID=1907575 RepID=UPI000BB95358|nr:DUF3046 domain-containing protein [Jatrophihabitans sp. GAS493]SOD74133.1 hypothetical protein SAMN05892883_3310 [Jatrophihabitans sp. GAS493]
MRITEFWSLMEAQFGSAYAHSLARDYRVPTLGSTVEQAIADGVNPKEIWRAVCAEFDVPLSLR